MKTILVPTDFSDPANNALDYAAHLAQQLKARILLLNVFWTPVYEFDAPEEIRNKEKIFRDYAEQELQKIEKRLLASFPGLQLDTAICNGLTGDEIVRMSQVQKAYLIVMGTRGASGWKEVIMGSNTSEVIEKSQCPVLAIPENARWKDLRHIVAAVDYHDSDLSMLCELAELAETYRARITVLHQTEEAISVAETAPLRQLTGQVRRQTKYPQVDEYLIEGDDLLEGLARYISLHPTDLLAMSTRKRGFFSRNFGTSYSKKMVHHTHIPLLVFQATDLPKHTV
jgi:nucleotide-binding universal stress UspA family protein